MELSVCRIRDSARYIDKRKSDLFDNRSGFLLVAAWSDDKTCGGLFAGAVEDRIADAPFAHDVVAVENCRAVRPLYQR
jgi:hypothetical protein